MTDAVIGRRWRSIAGPLLILRAAGQGAEFLGWVVLARRLGADAFGQLAIAFLICRYAGLVADWGATIRGVRDVAGGRGAALIHALVRRRTQLTIGFSILYVIGCVVAGFAALAPLVTVIASIGLSRDWLALGREQGGRSAVPAVVQGAVLLTLALVIASPTAPAIGAGVAYGLAAVVSIALNRLPPADTVVHGPVPVDGWMLLATMANQVLSSADTFLLALLASTVDAGIYAAIYRLPNAWLAAVAILAGSMLPLSAQLVGDRGDFRRLRRGALRVSIACAALLLVITPVIVLAVPVIFGADYEAGRLPVALLLLATAIATAAAPLHHLYLGFGTDRVYARFLVAPALLNIVLNICLIPPLAMTGAALATVAANALLAAELATAVHRWMRDRDRRHHERQGP